LDLVAGRQWGGKRATAMVTAQGRAGFVILDLGGTDAHRDLIAGDLRW